MIPAFCMLVMLLFAPLSALELIGDPGFQRGVSVIAITNPKVIDGVFGGRGDGTKPIWSLAQWDSRESIAGVVPVALPGMGILASNRYKSFEFTGDGAATLAVNAIEEYGARYRSNGRVPWPHLLLQQNISSPIGHLAASAPSLADLEALDFRIAVTLRKAEHRKDASLGYNARIHAAQFLMFLSVQNLNAAKAKGYGDYYWFGIGFYDDREERPKGNRMMDGGGDAAKGEKKGTGKYIFNVGLEPFSERGLELGKELRIQTNLLPLILEGLQAAWKRGMLGDSDRLEDYKIGGMNIGWEVPGLSDVSASFRNLSLDARGPRFPKATPP